MAFIFRFSSLATLVAAALAPLFVMILDGKWDAPAGLAIFMAALIFIRHRENVRRLLSGAEPRIGDGRAKVAP